MSRSSVIMFDEIGPKKKRSQMCFFFIHAIPNCINLRKRSSINPSRLASQCYNLHLQTKTHLFFVHLTPHCSLLVLSITSQHTHINQNSFRHLKHSTTPNLHNTINKINFPKTAPLCFLHLPLLPYIYNPQYPNFIPRNPQKINKLKP